MTTKTERPAARTVTVEFLYLNRTVCARCAGTDASLDAAVALARPALEATGVKVEVRKVQVESIEQARALGFISSPTIRVNRRDIAGELVESRCEDCGDCAGGAGVDCRVWRYQGADYTEAPVGLVVEAILGVVYGETRAAPPPARTSPPPAQRENLARFFAGKAQRVASGGACDCC